MYLFYLFVSQGLFDKYKIDAEYSIIQIEDSELSDVIEKIKNKDLHGINITLPFKQKIVPYLNILVNDAEITSSVNTVFLDNKNTVIGKTQMYLVYKQHT